MGACDQIFSSWAAFAQHCLDHLLGPIRDSADGPWTLRYRRQGPPGDDDDQGPSRSTSSYSAMVAMVRSSDGTGSGSHTSQGPQSNHTVVTNPPNYIGDTAESLAGPTYLVDVHLDRVVPAPEKAKYLALEYSWASRQSARNRTTPVRSLFDKEGLSMPADELPLPFERAAALTRDMGYRYLWVDYKCETTMAAQIRDAVYERAAFILVIVSMDSSSDQIWHFTCDHRNLRTVLSWFQTSIPSLPFLHVQNLGHGACGIVDEVQLRTSPESFARKVCIRQRDDLRSPDLHEIEILQKFDHPNIARFVAAYYQKRALNILMSTVAECKLKEYLSEPTAYDKRSYMPEWYYSLASAVDYMHSLSCRHKDIKPANVLISGRKVLLSDFGTSYQFSMDNSTSTGPGFMTPRYCAPEVARLGARGRKADIFSLGCVFVELITVDVGLSLSRLSRFLGFHEKPRSVTSVYHQHIERLREWLILLRLRASMAHQALVLRITDRMIDVQPQRRPSAAEVRRSLGAVLPPSSVGLGQSGCFSTGPMVLHKRYNALATLV